jgi:hypothetical protein
VHLCAHGGQREPPDPPAILLELEVTKYNEKLVVVALLMLGTSTAYAQGYCYGHAPDPCQ